MAHLPAFERDTVLSQRLLADAVKGISAAEAALSQHSSPDARLTAVNFPLEESLLQEAMTLWQAWQSQAADLLRGLDAKTASATLQFERLFDGNVGRETQGFLQRRVHLANPEPPAIAADLVELISTSATLEAVLAEARPFIVLNHRSCEGHVLRLESRRRQLDGALERAERQLEELKARSRERQMISPPFGGPGPSSAAEEERRTLALERHAAGTAEEQLRFERETLLRLIADDEAFLDVLNGGIAAVNVMLAKLKVDIEHRVALFKAAQAQSGSAAVALPDPVQQLVRSFEADVLAGHDLLSRKAWADGAFARRLEAAATVPEDAEEGAGETPTPEAPVPPVI